MNVDANKVIKALREQLEEANYNLAVAKAIIEQLQEPVSDTATES